MTRRTSTYDLLPVDEALDIVLEHSLTLSPELVQLCDAEGYFLAQDVFAKDDLPPFRASIMDGFALDGPGEFPVAFDIMAGSTKSHTLNAGSIARITTGAPVPDGADAVIKVEDTLLMPYKSSQGQDIVKIEKKCPPNQDIRSIGSDIQKGQLVLPQGTLIKSAEIGILAAVGASQVSVYPRPTVAILSTGDELKEPSDSVELEPGQIRDSNRYTLIAAMKRLGCPVIDLGISPDDKETLEKHIQDALNRAHILLTSGGVSMGELDLVKPILEKSGTVHFGRVHMKPGKPLTFATADINGIKKLVFGLPGNPVSSLVTTILFVIPSINKIKGYSNPHLATVQAKLSTNLKLDPTRPEYHRATITWDSTQSCYVAVSTGKQVSSRLLSMVSANALLLVPQGEGSVQAGTMLAAYLIDV